MPSLLNFAPPIPEKEYTIQVQWVVEAAVTVRASSQEEALVQAEAKEIRCPLQYGSAIRTMCIAGVPVNLVHDEDEENDW